MIKRLALWLAVGAWTASCENPSFPETEGGEPDSGTVVTPPDSGEDGGDDENRIPCLTVAEAQARYDAGIELEEPVWVVGYVVGCVSGTSTIKQIQFDMPTQIETNIVLADSKREGDYTKCLPIRLEKGTELRDELNLAAHPENHRRLIAVAGLLEAYYRVAGIREPLVYEWLTDTDTVPHDLPFPSFGDDETLIQGGRMGLCRMPVPLGREGGVGRTGR